MSTGLFSFIILIILEFGSISSCNLTANKTPDSAIDNSKSYVIVHTRARRTDDYQKENLTDEIENGINGNFPKQVDISKYKLEPAKEISYPNSVELNSIKKAIDFKLSSDFIQKYSNEDSIKCESKTEQSVQSDGRLDFNSKTLTSGKEMLPSTEPFADHVDETVNLKSYLISTSEDRYYNEAESRNNMSAESMYLHNSEESKSDIDHGEKSSSNQMANHVIKGSVEATLNSDLSFIREQRNVYIFNDSKSSTPVFRQNVNNLNHIAVKQPSEVRRHESSNNKAIGAYFHKFLKSDAISNDKYPTRIEERSTLERTDGNTADRSEASSVFGISKDILSQAPLLPRTNNHSSFQRTFTNTLKLETNDSSFDKTDHEYRIVDETKHESSPTLPDERKSKNSNNKICNPKLVQIAENKHMAKTAQIMHIQTNSVLSIANKTPQNEDDPVTSETTKEIKHTVRTAQIMPNRTDNVDLIANKIRQKKVVSVTFGTAEENLSSEKKHTAKTAQIMPIQTDRVLSIANKTPQNEDDQVTSETTTESLSADIKHTVRVAQIMPNPTDNVDLIANKIRQKKVVPVTFGTAEEILSTDSGFDFFEIVHIIKTDHNVQAYIINVLILYVPVFICDALLWLVIVKLFRQIRRQIAFNESQASKKSTPSAGKYGSQIGELKEDGAERRSSTQKLSCKSRCVEGDSDEEYRDSNTEFLTAKNGEKIWFPPN